MGRLLSRAIRLPRRVKRVIQLLADMVLLSASFHLALLLKQDSLFPLGDPHTWNVLLLSLPVTLLVFIWLGFYRAVIRYMNVRALQALVAGVGTSIVLMYITGQITGLDLPLSLLFIYGLLAMLSMGGVRFFLRNLYRHQLMRYKTPVVIYGAGDAGSQLACSLRQGSEYVPIAFVDDWRGMHGTLVEGLRVYAPESLLRLINDHGAERVLLAMPSVSRNRHKIILKSLATLNVPILTVPGAEDVVSGRASIQDIRDVAVEDLLGRDPVPPRQDLLDANIRDKVVMVTGAGGSIGSELCRQILRLKPYRLVLVDNCEYALYAIERELRQAATGEGLNVVIEPLLCSVQQRSRLEPAMRAFKVKTLYHAAAYKHVPMLEYNVLEGVHNNVFGTLMTAQAAIATGVETFVMVSTDKAVRPTNVMGTTKRLAELICQALSLCQHTTHFCMVRFGNVLGSSGSVIPLFRHQIAQGGPVTVTHEAITRYFMTIPEAATLVLQAGAMGKGGDVFVLDMGTPVKIAELAHEMVRLSGLTVKDADHPQGDIEIHYTGLRPGEKLYEELLVGKNAVQTQHPRILSAREECWEWPRLEVLLRQLDAAIELGDLHRIRQLLLEAPTGYTPHGPITDLVWNERFNRPKPPAITTREPEPQEDAEADALLKAATVSLFKGTHY